MKKLRVALLLKLLIAPAFLSAHPMGNFSISHHSAIHVSSSSIVITTIFDFAEVATFQAFPDPRKAADHANEWLTHLHLQAGGRTLPLQLQDVRTEIVPASTGLPTLRVQLQTNAQWVAADATLRFTDENYPNRIGWKEIVVDVDKGLSFPHGNPYVLDRSHKLTVFPEDLLSSAPDVVSASVRVSPVAKKEITNPCYVNCYLSQWLHFWWPWPLPII
jgi:nickel/cobalt transporter (NicO) family protein